MCILLLVIDEEEPIIFQSLEEILSPYHCALSKVLKDGALPGRTSKVHAERVEQAQDERILVFHLMVKKGCNQKKKSQQTSALRKFSLVSSIFISRSNLHCSEGGKP